MTLAIRAGRWVEGVIVPPTELVAVSAQAALHLSKHEIDVRGPSLAVKTWTPNFMISAYEVIDRSIGDAPQEAYVTSGFVDGREDDFKVQLARQLVASEYNVRHQVIFLCLLSREVPPQSPRVLATDPIGSGGDNSRQAAVFIPNTAAARHPLRLP
jgi:hypothetical protein